MRIDRLGGLIILLGLAGPLALAQNEKLTGTWNLNVAKSFMGSDHPTADYRWARKIEQKDGRLSITDITLHATMANIPLADATAIMQFAADGKEYDIKLPASFPGIPEMPGKVSGEWQGCTLEFHQIVPAFGGSTKERLFLSPDGAQLIALVEQHSTYGDTEQRLVFDRKE
jgi:hypothetical protein